MGFNLALFDWLIALLFSLTLTYAVFVIFLSDEDEQEYTRLLEDPRTGVRRSLFLRIFGRLIYFLGGVFALLPFDQHRRALEKKLTQAGRPGQLTADEFDATRVVGVLVLGLAGAYVDFELASSPMFMLLLGGLGFIYPDIWLSGMIIKRRRAIFRNLPDTLDILRLAVDAGLDLGSAMTVVVERGRRGPLLDELEQVEREMSLGRNRRDALKNFADRVAMVEINSFVLALNQADQLGASIGPVLKTQSEMARTKRWQMAETLVNKMPMKMLGPLVLFIFPSSFIILFTPLVIQWLQTK